MSLFGDLDVRLETWEVEYGSETPIQAAPETADENVGLDLEAAADAWRPVVPSRVLEPKRLVFVDGVRRAEARLWVRRAEKISRGVLGSYGVGCVVVAEGRAEIGQTRVDRIVALGSGEGLPGPVTLMPALTYRPLSAESEEVDAPLQLIQEEMRLAEERLARELAQASETLVVADGPLTFGERLRGEAVGYIKRLHKLYVDGGDGGRRRVELLSRLPVGTRSPLFALHSSRRFARYSWFLRLAAPHRGESPFSGLARLEVSEVVGVETAKRLADATAIALPRFASGRGRDPRSPQNLVPIGALESHLRRRLGDPLLIRRHIGTLLAAAQT